MFSARYGTITTKTKHTAALYVEQLASYTLRDAIDCLRLFWQFVEDFGKNNAFVEKRLALSCVGPE